MKIFCLSVGLLILLSHSMSVFECRAESVVIDDVVLDVDFNPWLNQSFVIVASLKTFEDAEKKAKNVSKKLGYPLKLRGLTNFPSSPLPLAT